jgi:hypothetical protein
MWSNSGCCSRRQETNSPSYGTCLQEKSSIFRDIMPCTLMKVILHFARKYRFHLQPSKKLATSKWLMLFVQCLQIWSVLTLLVSSRLGKGTDFISDLGPTIGLILLPPLKGRSWEWLPEENYSLKWALTHWRPHVLQILKVKLLTGVKISTYEEKNWQTDLTRNQTQNLLNTYLILRSPGPGWP